MIIQDESEVEKTLTKNQYCFLEVKDYDVYGMDFALKYSNLPMVLESEDCQSSFDRLLKLRKNSLNSGHNSILKAIMVNVVIKHTHVWAIQAMRYHWFDIASSTSKMHRAKQMFPDHDWDTGTFEEQIGNLPLDTPLTVLYCTNYLQLATMYQQRKTHRLQSWQNFCRWCEMLDNSSLITGV